MYKQILTPTRKNHSIELPENLYGKKVEVTVTEITDEEAYKSNSKAFLDDIEPIPDFPQIDKIRESGWPDRW